VEREQKGLNMNSPILLSPLCLPSSQVYDGSEKALDISEQVCDG